MLAIEMSDDTNGFGIIHKLGCSNLRDGMSIGEDREVVA